MSVVRKKLPPHHFYKCHYFIGVAKLGLYVRNRKTTQDACWAEADAMVPSWRLFAVQAERPIVQSESAGSDPAASGPTRVKLTCHRLPPSAWHAATPASPPSGGGTIVCPLRARSSTPRGGGPVLLQRAKS